MELETLFGINESRGHGYFPASAYRGPFFHLLRHHYREGLEFIISVFNHSAEWYAHPRIRMEHVEPPFEITLTFADGMSKTQWCNPRLWGLYRGISVGPCVLQSLLMALERWFLEVGELYPRALDALLLDILKRSDSAALTAVVASAATAFPRACGETLFVLLSSPVCILLDRQYTIAADPIPEPQATDGDPTPPAEGPHYIRLDAKDPEPDVKEMMDMRSVNAVATDAILVQLAANAESVRPYPDRRPADAFEEEAAREVRRRFSEADGIPADAHQSIDISQWYGAAAYGRMLAILGQVPTEPAAIAAFRRVAHTLVEWWNADNDRQRQGQTRRRERNYETEGALTDLLENFLLRTSEEAATAILQPILNAIDANPRELHRLLSGLISAEDRQPNTPRFWLLWRLFADRVRRARWLAGIDNEHPYGGEMMSDIFLGSWWKDTVRHWRSLEGHAHNIHSLFEDLPASSSVLDDYVRFLYHIGEQSLPEAFIRIAKRLQQSDPTQLLHKGNTVYMLEVLLQRYVYGRPLELKRANELRTAVLVLLDLLIESGSSAAYRMRDDFVTPLQLP